MLKKILLSLGVVGALATQCFSSELKLDKEFCKAYNYATYNHFIQDKSLDNKSVANRHIILKESGYNTPKCQDNFF